ncbi:MAG: DsbA family oxidoreductase, partial [Actinobacteria bacterium]|nr:DsbA family oxidoreductase [Actinomycetota bacterium]
MNAATETLRVDIWSDVVCPWCAIGKANLDAALVEFAHSDNVEIIWHSYELDPTAPAARQGDYVGMLSKKYGTSPEEAQAMIDRMTATGEE